MPATTLRVRTLDRAIARAQAIVRRSVPEGSRWRTSLSASAGTPRSVSEPVVLDSSALLCLLNAEPGADEVAKVLQQAVISTVNLAEVAAKLRERGVPAKDVYAALDGLPLDPRPFTADQAHASGDLPPAPGPSVSPSATAPASPSPESWASRR